MANATLPENYGNGLMGYISANVSAPTNNNYGYGVGFYASAWPLVPKPIASFQIGLLSTWVIPNNNNFNKALCPTGTYARDNWPSWGPTWNGVFQTIEGGLGFWVNTQFPSTTPKFRLNATTDCYNTEVSSTGWQFGTPTPALTATQTAIAQYSNRILLPPDGLTFANGTNGQVLGNAWMAMPIRPKTTSPVATGNDSWMLFLNAQNFAGPVAFYFANAWSNLSQNYSTSAARGLDTQPGSIDSGAMEVNTVPYFAAEDASSTTYTRIPQLQFPVDANGNTLLMEGMSLYAKSAFYAPLQDAFQNGKAVPKEFATGSNNIFKPTCTANPLEFTQGNQVPLTGFDATVQTYCDNTSNSCTFGLKWKNVKSATGNFPDYFKQSGSDRVAVAASQVPASTNLQSQTFAAPAPGTAYTGSAANAGNQQPITVTLADGSTLTYRWYKFVNQPALQGLKLTTDQKNKLQNKIVKLQKAWNTNINFMTPPTTGTLATLDPALLVTPPSGMEYGYVPIVISQNPPASAMQSVSAMSAAAAPDTQKSQHFMFKKSMLHKNPPIPADTPCKSATRKALTKTY